MSNFSSPLDRAEYWLSTLCQDTIACTFRYRGPQLKRRLKLISEISFLYLTIASKPPEHLCKALLPIIFDASFQLSLLSLARYNLEKANLILPMLVAICQRETSSRFLRDVAELVNLMSSRGRELPVFRQIDYFYSLWCLTGNQDFYETCLQLGQFGCISSPSVWWNFPPKNAYALTHTVFYLTNFGQIGWPKNLISIEKLICLLDMLSLKAESEQNLDLVAEYTMCRHCLNIEDQRSKDEKALLISKQNSDGSWQGPATEESLKLTDEPNRNIRRFFKNYHTTLVCAFALRGVGKHKQQWTPQVAYNQNLSYTPGILSRYQEITASIQHPYYSEIASIYLNVIEGRFPEVNEEVILLGLTEPKSCLATMSCLYWLKKLDVLSETMQDVAIGLIEESPIQHVDNPRFLRIWVTAVEISSKIQNNIPIQAILLNLAELLFSSSASWCLQLDSNSIDKIVTLLLIQELLDIETVAIDLKKIVETFLANSTFQDNPFTVASILPYFINKSRKEFVFDLFRFVDSMHPWSLDFGWVNHDLSNHKDVFQDSWDEQKLNLLESSVAAKTYHFGYSLDNHHD